MNRENYNSSSAESNKDTCEKFSEISNISEGQLVNLGLTSEGELSLTIPDKETDISKEKISTAYLADVSADSGDTNNVSVKKEKEPGSWVYTSENRQTSLKPNQHITGQKLSKSNNSSFSSSENISDNEKIVGQPEKNCNSSALALSE